MVYVLNNDLPKAAIAKSGVLHPQSWIATEKSLSF